MMQIYITIFSFSLFKFDQIIKKVFIMQFWFDDGINF